MIAIDFGEGKKFAVAGFDGELPQKPRGLTPAGHTAWVIGEFLKIDDVVIESPGIGSSGIEPRDIKSIVADAPHTLYTVSARAVKNLCKDCGTTSSAITDQYAANMIREIAERPGALRRWVYVDPNNKFQRKHTSVRPHDKRNYKGPEVDAFMQLLPPFSVLPENLQYWFSNGNKKADYARARALPFAMALDEAGADSRDGYEKIIGLYAHGYPSFYRRATVNLMQRIAKDQTGKTHVADITPGERKEALRETRRVIRKLYSLSK